MMRKRGFTVIEVLVVLAVVGVLIGAFWIWRNRTLPKGPSPTPTSVPTAKPTTYEDQKFHYQLQIPAGLVIESSESEDDPQTTEIETGEEGFFIAEKKAKPGDLRKTMVVEGRFLTDVNKELSFKNIVETQGSFINLCHEDVPQKIEVFTSKSGEEGIKAWYWVKKGCQGAQERVLNDVYAFFDARPTSNAIITFYEGQLDDYFDDIVSSFKFIEVKDYGD